MVVEGAVLNPAFKLLGKGITTLSKPISSKLSVLNTSNVPKNIRSKKYAERQILGIMKIILQKTQFL